MLPAILEKATYGIAVIWLFMQHRVASLILGFAIVDLIFGALFVVAFLRTGRAAETKS